MYNTIEADIKLYLQYTKNNKQTARAPVYIRRFLRKGQRYETLKKYLAEAYSNNGDEKLAERVMR